MLLWLHEPVQILYPSAYLRVPSLAMPTIYSPTGTPMEVAGYKTPTLAPTVGRSSWSPGNSKASSNKFNLLDEQLRICSGCEKPAKNQSLVELLFRVQVKLQVAKSQIWSGALNFSWESHDQFSRCVNVGRGDPDVQSKAKLAISSQLAGLAKSSSQVQRKINFLVYYADMSNWPATFHTVDRNSVINVVKQPEFLWMGRRTRSTSTCLVACGLLSKL
jgi:hypothetical protein